MFFQMLKMVAQSIASTSSPQRETCIKTSRVFKFNLLHKWLLNAFKKKNPLPQIAILDGMSIIFCQSYICLGQFVCHSNLLPHMSSLKYFFVLTLMSKCLCKFQEFSFTHGIFFFSVSYLQQYSIERQFNSCDSIPIISWIITKAKIFGCIKYWKVWKTTFKA